MLRRFRKSMKWPVYNLDQSLSFALRGLGEIFKSQRNARIIFLAAIFAFILGIYLKINTQELLVLILTIGLVFVAEIFNTMTEEIINILSPGFNPRVKIIKDISAAAVLIASLTALFVGYFVFAKKIFCIF